MPAGCRWLTPVILATQEAEIRRIAVRGQPRQIVFEILSRKKTHPPKKADAGGVAQSVGPEFNPSTAKNKNKQKTKKQTNKQKRCHLGLHIEILFEKEKKTSYKACQYHMDTKQIGGTE
jgi:hypothetical protein